MEDRIRGAFPAARVELQRSSGGVFEVSLNDELIFSKRRTGRFPEWQEIRAMLAGQD